MQTLCEELDIQLNETPYWDCCVASIDYPAGGELPRLPPPARDIALTEPHNLGQGIVATCAASRLSTCRAAEHLHADESLLEAATTALAALGAQALERDAHQAHGRGPDRGHRLRGDR